MTGLEARARVGAVLLALAILGVVAWVWLLPPPDLREGPMRAHHTEVAPDGERYAFPANGDVYVWARAARNLLEKGDPCEARAAGACRDTRVLGPTGIGWLYAETLHVQALSLFTRAARLVRPQLPVTAAAAGLALAVTLAGTLAAFALGWRLGGPAGAIVASLLPALQSFVYWRGRDGDNDVWLTTLPLLAALALARSFRARTTRGHALGAAAAGLAMALLAWTWNGWIFFLAIWVAALVAAAALEWAKLRKPGVGVMRLGVFLAVSLGGTLAMRGGQGFRTAAGEVVARSGLTGPGLPLPWPDTFTTVSELVRPTLADVAGSAGGWSGLALAVLGVGMALARALYAGRTRPATPPIDPATPRPGTSREPRIEPGVPILIAVWLLAAVSAAGQASRFLELVASPVALGWACLAGAIADRVSSWRAAGEARRARWSPIAAGAVAVLAAATQIPVVTAAIRAIDVTGKRTTRAWWDSLAIVRDRAAPGAIVHVWWNRGSLAQYAARRRTSADGSTLRTHAAHWLARAFLAPEAEALGTLRMLGCGADALPLPEGDSGALALAMAAARDDLGGYRLLRELLTLDRPDAERKLARRGVDGRLAARLLAASHCAAGETWLVLSSVQAFDRSWSGLASFDFEAARALQLVRREGPARVRQELASRSGLAAEEADLAVRRAQRALAGDAGDMRIGPGASLYHIDALPCVAGGSAALSCKSADGTLRVDLAALAPPRIRVDGRAAVPDLLVSAEGGPGRRETVIPAPTAPGVAAIIDRMRLKAWIVPTLLARSTFVSLLLFEARDSRHFELVARKESPTPRGMERILTFRVRW